MNEFLTKLNFLTETRRGLKKIPVIKKLEMLKSDPDIYLHFSSVNKIGVNPRFDYFTPMGTYAYNLKNSWKVYPFDRWDENYDDLKNISRVFPFAPDYVKYMFILRLKKSKYDFIPDISKYTNTQSIKDSHKLKNKLFEINSNLLKKDSNRKNLENFYQKIESKIEDFVYNFDFIFSLTEALACHPQLDHLKIISSPSHNSKIISKRNMIEWTWIFKEVLNYGGFNDPGLSIVYDIEPTQAIFFDRSNFEIIDLVNLINREHSLPQKDSDQSIDQSLLRLKN